MRIYLDNAATTPVSPEVVQTMLPFFTENFGNPSAIHADGRKTRIAIEEARKLIAKELNASIGEIFFTSGGTESNNMALKCAVRDLGVNRIISSPTEHHCVLHTLESLALQQHVKVELLDLDEAGRPQLAQLETLLKQEPGSKTLVSLMHANNEIGVMIDFQKLSDLCKEHNAFLHSDTVQTMCHYRFDLQTTPVSFLSGSAHKFHGPKGIGFIYINGNNQIKPYIDGGGQERNMRAGTENLTGIIGLAKAFELAYTNLDAHHAHIQKLRTQMIARIKSEIPTAKFNGDLSPEGSLYTVLSICFGNTPKTDLLLMNLDIAGISASGGSACSSGAEKGSHVLAALMPNLDCRTIRFSFSHYNTIEEVDSAIDTLKRILG
jgi:cysteine desulfurase